MTYRAGRFTRPLLLPALLALSLSACGTLQVGVEPAATPRPTTTAPAQTAAAPTAVVPTLAPSPTVAAAPTSAALVDRVQVFLVALEDGGKAGIAIGCNDSLVAVERPVEPTAEPLQAAYRELLSIRDREYGQSGLYNALYQSDLTVDSITLVDGKATVRLSGEFALGGVCDNPRVEAQLTETALQFDGVNEVAVFVNGTPLAQALSLK